MMPVMLAAPKGFVAARFGPVFPLERRVVFEERSAAGQ